MGRKNRPARIDITGRKFGRWTVLSRNGHTNSGVIAWLCKCDCGIEHTVGGCYLRYGRSRSCGCLAKEIARISAKRKGSEHPSWKGGRKEDGRGYILLTNPDFPGKESRGMRPGPNTSIVYEHIVVMARHLGRPITLSETVHHKNGVRDDNRIENLELWSKSHPSGQRVSDKVAWAKDILSQYEPEALCARS